MLTCTCSREQVIMVLLKAVATHGDTASSHHWLQGVMLVTAYLVVSAGFFVHVDPVVPPAE